jgi:hypothetical protein
LNAEEEGRRVYEELCVCEKQSREEESYDRVEKKKLEEYLN